MRIIVTRPEEDAVSLANKLRLLGHHPILISLVEIVPRSSIAIPQHNYQLICLTSANGVRSLSDILKIKQVPLVAVGEQSLTAAIKAGFSNGIAKGGDIDGLVAYVCASFRPENGPILYISGSTVSGDLEGKLKFAGYDVDRLVTYDAMPARLDSSEDEITGADAVMLYSPRSAKIWLNEIIRLELLEIASKLKHFCLSTNVAAALPQSWKKCIARHPTEQAMFELLDYSGKAE